MPNHWYIPYLEATPRGVLAIDNSQNIIYMNRRAQEIVGLVNKTAIAHGPGVLEPGDYVFLIDYPLGVDDGQVSAEDLARIGIQDPDLEEKSMLLGMGVYDTPGVKAQWKWLPSLHAQDGLRLTSFWEGFDVDLAIDKRRRRMTITIDHQVFMIHFLQSYGHAVVFSKDRSLKFVQGHGYTIRNEALGNLLRGQPYLGKDPGASLSLWEGEALENIITPGPLTQRMAGALRGEPADQDQQLYEINKRLVLGSILPLATEKGPLAILEFNEIRDFNASLGPRPHLEDQLPHLDKDSPTGPQLVGQSPAMEGALSLARRVATLNYPVLIQGERGVGKSRLAREIHRLSESLGPFVKLSLGSMKVEAMEIALFGHPTWDRDGVIQQAKNGSLYLKDIDKLPKDLQDTLYETLQQDYLEDGSPAPRLIAGSRKDLKALVKTGDFSKDLYYWLSIFQIDLPSLRDRPEDIRPLAESFVKDHCQAFKLARKQLTPEALDLLQAQSFPGNIRELEHIIAQAVNHGKSEQIDAKDLRLAEPSPPKTLRQQLRQREREILDQAMKEAHGDKKTVMERLDISKTSLYDKLNDYGLS